MVRHILDFKIVIIGASTGGPLIIEEIMRMIPSQINAAFFIVQHMPEFYLDGFVSILKIVSNLKVSLAENNHIIKRGDLYLAPGSSKVFVGGREINNAFEPFIEIRKCYEKYVASPCIDDIMTSAASFFRSSVVGVVLSGIGQDGKLGMNAIKRCGGCTIVQDPYFAIVDEMPLAVINDKSAEFILSPKEIAKKIIDLC